VHARSFGSIADGYYRSLVCNTQAIVEFKEWFLKKTMNQWDNRHNFRQHPTAYNFIELSPVVKKSKQQQAKAAAAAGTSPCQLDDRVASLVDMLFDHDTILNSLAKQGVKVDSEFDLASVTTERVQKARRLLATISALLHDKPAIVVGPGSDGSEAREHQVQLAIWKAKLESNSNQFNQQIPAVHPQLLDTAAKVDEKGTMLDVLSDIALASDGCFGSRSSWFSV
jgi:hypothetical protein